jgi:hypothetical protein
MGVHEWVKLAHFVFSVKLWRREILKLRILLLHKEFVSSVGTFVEFILMISRSSAICCADLRVYQSVSLYI